MNWTRHVLIFFIRLYQRLLSPLKMAVFGPAGGCRFSPSCSHYAVEALRVHGVLKGGSLAAWRICRCHPWGGCGDDPVPPKRINFQNLKFNVAAPAGAGQCREMPAARAVAGGGN